MLMVRHILDMAVPGNVKTVIIVMVTEGDVTLDPGVAVGKWAGYACSYKLGPLEQVYMNAEEWGADYNSNTLPGFRFFNSNWR